MPRLVDLRSGPLGNRLVLEPGDIVLLAATGVRITSGSAVELLGLHQTATLLRDGRVLAPEGVPDVVVLSALMPGSSSVQLVTGAPFNPISTELAVTVREDGR
jgi:hypothetical protein